MPDSSPPPRPVRHRARPMPLETDVARRHGPVPAEPPPAFPSGSSTAVIRPEHAEAFEPEVTWRRLAALRPYDRNARTHSRKQLRQIAASIEQFGFTNPVLVDAEGGIIAGHGRVDAARLLGLDQVPTIRLDHLSEAQKRAYILADNRLAQLAGWNEELLAIELGELAALDLDFAVEITGFEIAEIDLLVEKLKAGPDAADEVPEIERDVPPVSQVGDLWQLGGHRLLCGDALDPECYARLMDGAQARMVFTDPPYNVPIDGHVCGLGKVRHREFAMASGEMSEDPFTAFLARALSHMAEVSADGALLYVFMDWRHQLELLLAGRNAGLGLVNLCVWNKDNAGMGSFSASKAEEIHDYSVCTTWGVLGTSYYLIDVVRARLEFPDLKRQAMTLARRHGPDAVLIEDAGSGTQLAQQLRWDNLLHPISIKPRGDKVTRAEAQTARIEARQVLLPRSAPWLDDFRLEVLAFPNGSYDDQVDSMVQFLRWIGRRQFMEGPRERPNPERRQGGPRPEGQPRSRRRPLSGLHYRVGYI